MRCYTLHNTTDINQSDRSMTISMHQSFVTGKVNGIPYRGLLDVKGMVLRFYINRSCDQMNQSGAFEST